MKNRTPVEGGPVKPHYPAERESCGCKLGRVSASPRWWSCTDHHGNHLTAVTQQPIKPFSIPRRVLTMFAESVAVASYCRGFVRRKSAAFASRLFPPFTAALFDPKRCFVESHVLITCTRFFHNKNVSCKSRSLCELTELLWDAVFKNPWSGVSSRYTLRTVRRMRLSGP